jgi:hypothetical protein
MCEITAYENNFPLHRGIPCRDDPARRNLPLMLVLFNLNTFSWKAMQPTALPYAGNLRLTRG